MSKPDPGADAVAEPPTPSGVRIISSRELMGGQRLLLIRHGSEAYRLQLTQAGKLILTK